jgi:hypothetical protein
MNAQMRYPHIDRKILQVVCEMRPTGYVACLKCRIFLVLAFTSFGSSVHEVFFVTIIRIPDRAVWFRRVGRENSEVGTEDWKESALNSEPPHLQRALLKCVKTEMMLTEYDTRHFLSPLSTNQHIVNVEILVRRRIFSPLLVRYAMALPTSRSSSEMPSSHKSSAQL